MGTRYPQAASCYLGVTGYQSGLSEAQQFAVTDWLSILKLGSDKKMIHWMLVL